MNDINGLLVAVVCFGLFCGGLGLVGLVADKLEQWWNGGRY